MRGQRAAPDAAARNPFPHLPLRRGYVKLPSLEHEPYAKLDLALGGSGVGEQSEIRIAQRLVRAANERERECSLIQDVEELGAELERHRLGDSGVLDEREIKVGPTRSCKRIATQVSGGGLHDGSSIVGARGGRHPKVPGAHARQGCAAGSLAEADDLAREELRAGTRRQVGASVSLLKKEWPRPHAIKGVKAVGQCPVGPNHGKGSTD